MKTIFQVTLKSIKILDNGMKNTGKESNLVSINLIYPREGVNSIEKVKSLKLENDKLHTFETENFSSKLLFKESIQGDSAILVKLAVVDSVSKIEKILLEVFKGALLAGAGLIPGGNLATTVIVGGAKKVVESVFDSKELKDKITQLGEIEFPINDLTNEGDLILNLSTKKKIVIETEKVNANGELERLTRTIPKGFGIAQVVLNIKKIKMMVEPVEEMIA